MSEIEKDISAYDNIREELEAKHMAKWVLFHDTQLIGTYDSFDSAAEEAVEKFGSGPYLIRQIGAPPVLLPVSVMHHLTHGKH